MSASVVQTMALFTHELVVILARIYIEQAITESGYPDKMLLVFWAIK